MIYKPIAFSLPENAVAASGGGDRHATSSRRLDPYTQPFSVPPFSVVDEDISMDTEEVVLRQQLPSLSLTTVNYDVQRHIMTFLKTPDLSALMRTCHLFSDIGLQPLCRRSGEPLRTPTQLLSLLEFLRAGAGPHTRAPFVKTLHFSLDEHRVPQDKASYFELHVREPASFPTSSNPVQEEHLLLATRNQALEAFLIILQHCCELRQLRIDRWFNDVPTAPLHHAISTLTSLEELRMPMVPRSQWCGAFKLTSCSLRSLVLRPGRWHEVPDALTLLQPLAATLVELDLPVCRWDRPAVPFKQTRRLSIELPASEDVVLALVDAFPSLTHLSLGGTRNFHLCHTLSSRIEEDRLREHAQSQWQSIRAAGAWWPSLVAVHAASPCALYTLALPFKVPRVSIGYAAGDPAPEPDNDMLQTILADTSPTCLEVRVSQAHYRYTPLPRRFAGLRRSEATASLERFVLTMEGVAVPDYLKVTSLLVDELREALAGLPVTHLLLKHALDHFPAARAHTRAVVRTLCAEAPRCAAAVARAVPALRWIGVLVRVSGGPAWLHAWTVGDRLLPERAFDFAFDRPTPGPTLLRGMGEDEGWEVLRAEGMEEFARA